MFTVSATTKKTTVLFFNDFWQKKILFHVIGMLRNIIIRPLS